MKRKEWGHFFYFFSEALGENTILKAVDAISPHVYARTISLLEANILRAIAHHGQQRAAVLRARINSTTS